MDTSSTTPSRLATICAVMLAVSVVSAPASAADNNRLNGSVVQMVSIVQYKAGCRDKVTVSPALRLAAQWHAVDVLNNRALAGGIGSDGSTPQDRANAAGYRGAVQETVAINPALAISGLELIRKWYHDPVDLAVMQNCANTEVGVWSENSLDRTVVVAVYGSPG
ncbi:MAG: CAP domain-containing protein [Mycolicibacterium sp.]